MSKKHIFFKRLQSSQYDAFYDQISRFNLSPYLTAFSALDNILQIVQIPDLRMLIFKNLNLQKELTENLPHHSPHGYLWSGEQWPDLEALLATASTIQSMFLFYKLGDTVPPFSGKSILKVASSYEVYNWQIFQLPAFSHLLTNLNITSANTEVEVERKIQDIISSPFRIPSSMLNEKENAHLKILQGVVNRLLNGADKSLFIQSSLPFDINRINLTSGSSVYFKMSDPLGQSFMESRLSLFSFSRESFSKLISNYMYYIRKLVLENHTNQSDLFLSTLWESFASYWNDEKKRLQSVLGLKMDNLTLKALAAARFVLDSAPFTLQPAERFFIHQSIIDTLKNHLVKKQSMSFIDSLHRELRKSYLSVYALDHMNSFFKLQHPLQILPQDHMSYDSVLGIFSGSDSFGDHPWPQIRQILQLPGKNRLPFDVSEEISKEGPWFRLLSVYGRQVLTRLLSEDKPKDCQHLFLRWLDVYAFLKDAGERLKPGGSGAIYFDSSGTKPKNRINEALIFQSFISDHFMPELNMEDTLDSGNHNGPPSRFSILIFVKPSHSD